MNPLLYPEPNSETEQKGGCQRDREEELGHYPLMGRVSVF